MYFHENKKDTNIDKDFKDNKSGLSSFLDLISKYKMIIFISIGLIFLFIIFLFVFRSNNQGNKHGITINDPTVQYLELNGDEIITIYQGSDYIEPGYKAYNSKDKDLNKDVVIKSSLNNKEIGEYEITYTLGNIVRTRKVNVVEKPREYTYIHLNGSTIMYLQLGEKYNEPGYTVFSSTGLNLTDKVNIEGKVDSSKKGTYTLIYSVVDSNNVTISKSRVVIVMDADISLSLDNGAYTNGDVTINVGVIDDYFDYMLLPNNNKVNENTYSYKVTENGKYTFKVYNKKGISKEKSIEVKNIDRTAPTGSCTIDYVNDGSIINISASDKAGIKKYVYNGADYFNNVISLSSYVDSVSIVIYDNANNTKNISCKSVALPTVSNISNDGVIVKISAKKINSNISGYYFSYTNKRPNKDSGGYIATSNESIDVVRLPGTTYVWVEEQSGKISKPATITLSNDVLLLTLYNSKYTVLRGTALYAYLKNNGWSITELNNLMARSVRAAGLYTKEGAATAAVTLEVVLAQKYNIKLPYWMGGKNTSMGADSLWGIYKENPTYEGYFYYGMDCDGLVNWSYRNAGVIYQNFSNDSYYYWSGIEYKSNNGEIGDILRRDGHVNIIIGKTDSSFIVAEAFGNNEGMVINTYPYTDKSGYTIIKGERLFDKYTKLNRSEYPSGF